MADSFDSVTPHTLNRESTTPETVPLNARFRRPNLSLWLGIVAITFGIVALVRVCHIILTVGGNNISNDYLDVTPFINRAFSGQINLSNLFSSLKVGQHIVALPIAFHFLSAYLFDWNARAELLIGVGINLVRSLLLWDLVAGDQRKEWRLLLFGVVLTLVFSMTQASVHFFGQACYPVSLTTLGFTVALWGLLRFKNDWRGTALMLVGGIGSALSMGNVPPCWFVLLLGLVAYGYRVKRWPVYLAWAVGSVLSIAPYLHFLVAKSNALENTQHAFSWIFMINLLGRPFANQVGLVVGRLPMAEFMGVTGLLMFAIALAANWRQRQFSLPVKSSLLLCAYGLSSAVMISCVRAYVTPWYGSFAIYFWIGLFGLLLSALVFNPQSGAKETCLATANSISENKTAIRSDALWKAACIICLVCFPFMYFLSNKSWKDKHVYLSARAPASEAALRNFRQAPSYIESLLFQWGDGRPNNVVNMARPLERYQLSAFAPDQTWSLQGDFVLPGVRVFNTADVPPVRFLEDQAVDHPVPWSHYEYDNLYVHAPNAVSWTFSLPADGLSARLKTAFAIASPDKKHKPAITDGVTGKIFAVVGDPLLTDRKELLQEVHASKAGLWRPIEIDLSRFKGKTVSLIFTADGGIDKQDDYSVFQYPCIDVKLRRRSAEENRSAALLADAKPSPWLPVNTDLNKDFGKNFASKFDLPPMSNANWRSSTQAISTPSDIQGKTSGVQQAFSTLTYSDPVGIRLDSYSHLLVSMKAPPTMPWRSLKAAIVLQDGKHHALSIPLPADADTHVCSFELKLCDLPQNGRLRQLVLYPVAAPGAGATDAITVNSVSLVKERMPAWLGH